MEYTNINEVTMTFEMFSFGHYLFMLSPFISLYFLLQLTKTTTMEKNRNLGILLSVFAIIVLLLRNLEIFITNGRVFDIELLPLQICHFANFVLLIAFLKKDQIWFNFALILNLPAAFVSILFANSLSNYETILTFRGFAYILGHMILVTLPLWAYFRGFIHLDFTYLRKTFVVVFILFIFSILMNNGLYLLSGQYANYFYSLKPENGTPLELFYDWGHELLLFDFFKINGLYLLLTAILGAIVMSVMYLILIKFKNKNVA
jgi:hypothetical protein